MEKFTLCLKAHTPKELLKLFINYDREGVPPYQLIMLQMALGAGIVTFILLQESLGYESITNFSAAWAAGLITYMWLKRYCIKKLEKGIAVLLPKYRRDNIVSNAAIKETIKSVEEDPLAEISLKVLQKTYEKHYLKFMKRIEDPKNPS